MTLGPLSRRSGSIHYRGPLHLRSNSARATTCPYNRTRYGTNAFPLKRRSGSRHSIIVSIAFPLKRRSGSKKVHYIFHCISAQTPLGLQTCLNGSIAFPLKRRSGSWHPIWFQFLLYFLRYFFVVFFVVPLIPLKRRSGSGHFLNVPLHFRSNAARAPDTS